MAATRRRSSATPATWPPAWSPPSRNRRRGAPSGPFFSTTGIARLLGGVSRQAVEDRRKRHRLIALRTEEGTWLYPAFQLDDDLRLLPASWPPIGRWWAGGSTSGRRPPILLGPQPELDGRSLRDHLAAGHPSEPVDDLLRSTTLALR